MFVEDVSVVLADLKEIQLYVSVPDSPRPFEAANYIEAKACLDQRKQSLSHVLKHIKLIHYGYV